MPRIQAVVFDLGNVLALHDNELLLRRMATLASMEPKALLERLDGPLWQRIHRGELPGDQLRVELCRRMGVELSFDDFFELWNCHFTINEPLLPLVEALVGKVKLLLLSNTNELHARFLLPKLPLLRRFDHLLLSHELGAAKPEEAIYRAALDRAGTAPEATAFFDDMPEYVHAACRLGIHGRLFRHARELPAQLKALGIEL